MTSTPLEPNPDLEGAIRELVASVGQLLEQSRTVVPIVQVLERTIARRTRAAWGALIALIVLTVALGGVALDNHRQIDSLKRQFCPVVEANLTGSAPSTQHGRDVEVAMRSLATRFGCDN